MRPKAAGYRLRASGFGKYEPTADSQQPTVQGEGFRHWALGIRLRGARVQGKVKWEFPLTSDPVRQAHDTALPRRGEED